MTVKKALIQMYSRSLLSLLCHLLYSALVMFGLNAIVQHFIGAHLSRNMQIKGLFHVPNYLPQNLNALLPPTCFSKPPASSSQLLLLQQGAGGTGCHSTLRNMKKEVQHQDE